MKLRILAALLIVTLAAWLPLAAQQSATSQAPATPKDSGKSAVTATGCCCDHQSQQDKSKTAGTPDHSAMACCHGKDAKDMACCGKDAKNTKASMDCCKGMDAKMCAKEGKSCCGSGDAKDGKSCCAKDCCASASDCCAGHAHAK
ncbi:MAG TPA: hypothetical protein VN830_00675 [Verrucomicrobiae bacterium]|nr:hypothetical protein [Verrucomicrobiae bacterium]